MRRRPDARTADRASGINQYASCGLVLASSSRTPGRLVTLKRNPHYKGGRAASVGTIQVGVGNGVAVCSTRTSSAGRRTCLDLHPGHRVATVPSEVRAVPQGRARAGSVAARRRYIRDEPWAPALRGQPRAREGGQLERSTGGRSWRRAPTCTPSAPGRSSLRGSSASSRRGSPAAGPGQHDQAGGEAGRVATSRGGNAVSGRPTRGRHRSRYS